MGVWTEPSSIGLERMFLIKRLLLLDSCVFFPLHLEIKHDGLNDENRAKLKATVRSEIRCGLAVFVCAETCSL